MASSQDARWLGVAATLAERARPLSRPNPAVGVVIVKHGIVVGRGWTQPGGRPHAEAVALAQAGGAARGATLYVTLEPCAHHSARGPACADIVGQAGLERVVTGVEDPDLRTAGQGLERLRRAGVEVSPTAHEPSTRSLAGYIRSKLSGVPETTLKLAVSLDGCLAMGSGESQWITGTPARAHAHRERARADAILVGGGTLRADGPRLDVRLPGLEGRSPERWLLTRGAAPEGWTAIPRPSAIADRGVQHLLVEGGAAAAAAFLAADLVDRLLVYRAPILIGAGKPSLGDIGLGSLAQAHDRWRLTERRQLGTDTLEVYYRAKSSGA